MSLDLGPVRYRSPEELAEATAWLERQRGGSEVDLRTPGDVVRHDLAMAMAKPKAKARAPGPCASMGTLQSQQRQGEQQPGKRFEKNKRKRRKIVKHRRKMAEV